MTMVTVAMELRVITYMNIMWNITRTALEVGFYSLAQMMTMEPYKSIDLW